MSNRHILSTDALKETITADAVALEVREPVVRKKIYCSDLDCGRSVYKVQGTLEPHNIEMVLPDGCVYVLEFVNKQAAVPQKVAEFIQGKFPRSLFAVVD